MTSNILIKPPIRAWSFSRLLDFESCPYRIYLDQVAKSPKPEQEEDNPLVRGERIHKAAENYIKGEGELTKELQKPLIVEHIELCKGFYDNNLATVEENWAFDEDWGPTGWYDDNTWLRVKIDVSCRVDDDFLEVTDWKSGKSQGKEVRNMQQAQIYATTAMLRNPQIDFVTPIFAYTDENKIIRLKPIERRQINLYMVRYAARAQKLTSCLMFKAKPNKINCNYCPFGERNTKACVHRVY